MKVDVLLSPHPPWQIGEVPSQLMFDKMLLGHTHIAAQLKRSTWKKKQRGRLLTITVCAVAQHCYNGDVSFLWEKWKL